MFQLRILSVIFISYISVYNLMGQEIRAELQKTYQDKDSLVVTLTLTNTTNKPLYLVCGADVLTFYDFIPIRENYGSFKAEVECRKKNQSIDRNGNIRDTIRLVIPTTKEQFQVDSKGKENDIFRILSELQEIACNKEMSMTVPIPPNDSVLFASYFIDLELYRLFQRKNIVIGGGDYYFCEQTIILQPNEKKNFSIDLGYLLLRKATYQMVFDYKTDNKLFKKETKFLKRLGFHRFKGEITSNVISIVSE